ncbi:hypothetical protein Bpla01_32100 [Burkholderia plantarii]|nr:hypothetical protein Bpla01_32100 [Burkholderia plantarii]
MVNNAPKPLLEKAELIVFLNADPIAPIDYSHVENRLERIQALFHSMKVVRSERFELTAEESAHSASAHAQGKYIWLAGDKRIFLPEGLRMLAKWLEAPTTPAAYFNSSWIDQTGKTNNYPSTHMLANHAAMPYKLFVMSTGINFIATGMGAWIFERRCLDRAVWKEIIVTCGPHFSHVTTALAMLDGEDVQYFSMYLVQIESKAYHAGDDSEWARYSKLAKTYRYYAWTFGLIRQFNYLIAKGVYDHGDVRRSMCSEGTLLRRQVDEIYSHIVAQIRFGWFKKLERITQTEFDEVYDFLCRVCPEKAILNDMIKELYVGCNSLRGRDFTDKIGLVLDAIGIDSLALRFGTLIVSQLGDSFVRLHPRGFIVSRVSDNDNFMLAYKLIDAPAISDHWQILTQKEMDEFVLVEPVDSLSHVYPISITPAQPTSALRKLTHRVVVYLYRSRLTYAVVNMAPGAMKRKLRAMLY